MANWVIKMVEGTGAAMKFSINSSWIVHDILPRCRKRPPGLNVSSPVSAHSLLSCVLSLFNRKSVLIIATWLLSTITKLLTAINSYKYYLTLETRSCCPKSVNQDNQIEDDKELPLWCENNIFKHFLNSNFALKCGSFDNKVVTALLIIVSSITNKLFHGEVQGPHQSSVYDR